MRYVLLKHEKDNDFHVDFLLDCGQERLLTWQIVDHNFFDWLKFDGNFFIFAESPNIINDTFCLNCQRVFDHRRKYLDFSGDLGDQRGYTIRIECGDWGLQEVCARHLIIKTAGTRLVDNTPTIRQWHFGPPVAITLNPEETSSGELMQQLPPPSKENWVVHCTRVYQEMTNEGRTAMP